MKPKLLITLGCSWTEGVGCYEEEFKNIKDYSDELDYYVNSYDRFHNYGWPKLLGKKLGFDKVINFGKGGSSNSRQSKVFYDYMYEHDLSNYDVLVIFLMTIPHRFSFYIDGRIRDYTISDREPYLIEKGYIEELVDLHRDSTLEQVYAVRTIEQLCENKNFDFLITSWVDNIELFLSLYNNSKRHLFPIIRILLPPKDKEWTYYAPCSHPNELGYEWMSNEMVKGIKQKHPNWYSETPNPNIEMEWLGDYERFSLKNNLI